MPTGTSIRQGTMAGISLDVRIQTDLVVWTSGLNTVEIRKAINRAINYATRRAQTRIKRTVVSEYNLKSSQVNDGSLLRVPSTVTTLTGFVYGSSRPESLGHFGPTEYKTANNVIQKTQRRGKYYTGQKLKRNTGKSGVYFSVVKGKQEHIQNAWLWFSGSTPIVMARGKYDTSAGDANKTSGFKFSKPRYPITKLNTKSVYWGVLHPKSIQRWEPETEIDYLNELTRQCEVILQMR